MTNRLQKFTESKPVWSSLIFIILFIGLTVILGQLVMAIFGERINEPGFVWHWGVFGLGQLLLGFLFMYFMHKVGVSQPTDFACKGVGRGLLLGWGGWIIVAISATTFFAPIPAAAYLTPPIVSLLVIVFHVFATGFYEEVVVRGLVFRVLLRKMGANKKGVIGAVFLSAALFGISHISNVFSDPNTMRVLAQVFFALMGGAFFAALFLRTGRLWVTIVIHALVNLPGYLRDVIVSPEGLAALEAQSQTNILLNPVFQYLSAGCLFLVFSLLLLAKYKVTPAVSLPEAEPVEE